MIKHSLIYMVCRIQQAFNWDDQDKAEVTQMFLQWQCMLVITQQKYNTNSDTSMDSIGDQYKWFAINSVTDVWKQLVKTVYPNTLPF